MKRKSFLWSIPLVIFIFLLTLPVVSYGQLTIEVPDRLDLGVKGIGEAGLVKNGKNYGKIIFKDGHLTVAKDTKIKMIHGGGIIDNLDGIVKGNIHIKENFVIEDKQGNSYNISRTLRANKKGISIDKVKVTDNKGKILKLKEVLLAKGYYIDLNQEVLCSELEVKTRTLPIDLSIIVILSVALLLLFGLLLIYLFKRKKLRGNNSMLGGKP